MVKMASRLIKTKSDPPWWLVAGFRAWSGIVSPLFDFTDLVGRLLQDR